MGEIFANPLTELAEYGDMKQDLMKGKGPVQICGVTDSQKVHVMYQVSEEKAWRLVVTHDDTRARELYDDFSYFEKNTWLYPARDLLFYSSDIHGNLLTRQRMQVFKHLMEDVGGTVVTTVDGLMDHLLPLSMMKERRILVESGEVLDIGDMKERLRDLGYERTGPFLAFSLTTLFFWSFAFRHLKDDLPRQKTEKRGRMPLFIYFCGLLEILAFTGEGSIGDWGSIFLHSAKGATEATAALSFGVCALAMTLVRTQSDSLREKIGDQKLIGGGALLAAAGFLLSIFVSNPWVCLVGFAMIGAGIAPAVPVIMSRAGTYPGVDPGAACATVSTLGYGTLLFIPPLLGSVAEHVGLDTAFFIPFTMALLLFAGSFALKPRN